MTKTPTEAYTELQWPKVVPPLDGSRHPVVASSSSSDDLPNSSFCHDNNGHDDSQVASTEASPPSSMEPNTTGHDAPHDEEDSSNCLLPLIPKRTVLLVVDVQPEYWSQCPAVRRDFPDFPNRLASTVQTCRQQECAQIVWVRADYRYDHSPWLKQFARLHRQQQSQSQPLEKSQSPSSLQHQHSSSSDASDNSNDHNRRLPDMRTEVPCNPFDWEDFATPQPGELILPKSSWSSTSNTQLMDILSANNIDTVLVCGLITSVCVQHSAFGVFEAGYRTILVHDACADRGLARHQAALALYGNYMYELVTSRQLQHDASVWSTTTTDAISQKEKPKKKPTSVYKSPVLTCMSSPITLGTVTTAASVASSLCSVPSELSLESAAAAPEPAASKKINDVMIVSLMSSLQV